MQRANGITLPLPLKVGDRYVLEEMLKGGYNIGGEQSQVISFFLTMQTQATVS